MPRTLDMHQARSASQGWALMAGHFDHVSPIMGSASGVFPTGGTRTYVQSYAQPPQVEFSGS
jgi:hypothetical protein